MHSKNLNIKSWAKDDRPREKLSLKGKNALSDAELIAILLGSGSRTDTAVDLSKKILNAVNNDLNKLSKLSMANLMQFKGIGEAKAISIIAALELGRRRNKSAINVKPKVITSKIAYNVIKSVLSDLPHEEFWVIYLNKRNEVVSKSFISKGGIAGTVVDTKIILKKAIEQLSSAIVLCHNHPSGNLNPSPVDIQITKKIKTAAEIMDVMVIDHLIIGEKNYFSFADEGIL